MFPLAAAQSLGLGFQIAGAIGSYQENKGYYQSQKNIAALEQQQQQQQWNLQQIGFQRSQLQAVRNGQQARAQAEAAAVGSGAQFGSAAAGAQASVTGAEDSNLLGISQNWQIGAKEYDISKSINAQQIAAANYQEKASFWGGVASLGGSVNSSAGNLNKLLQ